MDVLLIVFFVSFWVNDVITSRITSEDNHDDDPEFGNYRNYFSNR